MSLQVKVTLIVVIVFILSALTSFGIQRLSVLPRFHELETETAIKNAERVLEALHRELDQIGPSVSDWANWTDIHAYIKGQNPDYGNANVDDGATLAGLQMNYLGSFDISGRAA